MGGHNEGVGVWRGRLRCGIKTFELRLHLLPVLSRSFHVGEGFPRRFFGLFFGGGFIPHFYFWRARVEEILREP